MPSMRLRDLPEETNRVSEQVMGSAIEVHRALGPGLLEGAYRDCLAYELRERGLVVQEEAPLPLRYKTLLVKTAFRADLLVQGCVIVELKCVESLRPEHAAQVLTYLKASGCRLGMLFNFHAAILRDDFRRLVV